MWHNLWSHRTVLAQFHLGRWQNNAHYCNHEKEITWQPNCNIEHCAKHNCKLLKLIRTQYSTCYDAGKLCRTKNHLTWAEQEASTTDMLGTIRDHLCMGAPCVNPLAGWQCNLPYKYYNLCVLTFLACKITDNNLLWVSAVSVQSPWPLTKRSLLIWCVSICLLMYCPANMVIVLSRSQARARGTVCQPLWHHSHHC